MPNALDEASEGSRYGGLLFGWQFLLRFLVPLILAIVLFFVVEDTWEMITKLSAGK